MVAPNHHCGAVGNPLNNLPRVGSVIHQIAQHPELVPSLRERLQRLRIGEMIAIFIAPQDCPSATRVVMRASASAANSRASLRISSGISSIHVFPFRSEME